MYPSGPLSKSWFLASLINNIIRKYYVAYEKHVNKHAKIKNNNFVSVKANKML